MNIQETRYVQNVTGSIFKIYHKILFASILRALFPLLSVIGNVGFKYPVSIWFNRKFCGFLRLNLLLISGFLKGWILPYEFICKTVFIYRSIGDFWDALRKDFELITVNSLWPQY